MDSQLSKSHYRIVVKLREEYPEDFSCKELLENAASWQDCNSQPAILDTSTLFTTLSRTAIRNLESRAGLLDPHYLKVNFNSYHSVQISSDENLAVILQNLNKLDIVELAYAEPGPVFSPGMSTARIQSGYDWTYTDPAPFGIDAKYIHQMEGGKGKGPIKFINIEQGWLKYHRDLVVEDVDITGINNPQFYEHGTAVMGIISRKSTTEGGIGIAPMAKGYVISPWRPDGRLNPADAILSAISVLETGDILLIELQTTDPFYSGICWPIEIQEACFQTIRLATALGITVIEPAANGHIDYDAGFDLDKYLNFQKRQTLNRTQKHFGDSGAIMVASAKSTLPHEKCNYSNFGSRVDCFAWGENLITTGAYPRSSGMAVNMYTDQFGGTSGAAAIIAGAAIALQSISAVKFAQKLSPSIIRSLLSDPSSGTNSANGKKMDRIGMMPDLKKISNSLSNFHDPEKRIKC